MSLLLEISFFELALSLIALGLAERLVCRLPEGAVGPGGWLIDTRAAR